ncbi:glutathione S-transferase family protein [Aestuariibacter sp. AA17]|uniref:Glutathione S-transferase family protein n=1 Tax=Fluctibacter corallii TaxID=2984329 RepID=A0ABT3A4X6_9ALTE|nr:glutathione S-transferase family protein [Aestuariibacter sp. AA17]MCV2883724.1 glutathione S-transferase family protein [Aestuariibacter sp. AA17]
MFTLYGSTTSPYVRRLRMWLHNVEHEFVNMKIFEDADRELLKQKNPTLKIPMLEDDGDMILDSRVIFRYLTEKLNYPILNWYQENQLTVLDSLNDAGVNMFILSLSNIDTSQDAMYFNIQRERFATSFAQICEQIDNGDFDEWNYPAISLYALVDWMRFRNLYDYTQHPALVRFMSANSERSEVLATSPD